MLVPTAFQDLPTCAVVDVIKNVLRNFKLIILMQHFVTEEPLPLSNFSKGFLPEATVIPSELKIKMIYIVASFSFIKSASNLLVQRIPYNIQ
jgi:hypothetical protein